MILKIQKINQMKMMRKRMKKRKIKVKTNKIIKKNNLCNRKMIVVTILLQIAKKE